MIGHFDGIHPAPPQHSRVALSGGRYRWIIIKKSDDISVLMACGVDGEPPLTT